MPVFFDDLAFVHIPKNAGTSIVSSLAEYSKEKLISGAKEFYRSHESLSEIEHWYIEKYGKKRWQEATIISTVRDPVERAVSWWKYRKTIERRNLSIYKGEDAFNMLGSALPYVTPVETHALHARMRACRHGGTADAVEKIATQSFHDWLREATVWKYSGCEYPNCPHHILAPQICWLHSVDKEIQLDRIKLFLVERIDELERFLPEMPQVGKLNVQKSSGESYLDHLTPESLDILQQYYAEDFELYRYLKSMPPQNLEPIYFPREIEKKKRRKTRRSKNASIS